MNKKVLAITLFICAFFSPLIISQLAAVGKPMDEAQWSGLQGILMGVYNLPFILVAGIFLGAFTSKQKNDGPEYGIPFFIISVVASLSSILFMLIWAFNA